MSALPTVRSASVMQSLEQRVLLSATQSVSNGILTITLDNNSNAVNVGYTDSQGSNVEVVVNAGTPTLYAQTGGSAQPITGVHIHMGNGVSAAYLMDNITGPFDELYSLPTTIAGGNCGDVIDDQGLPPLQQVHREEEAPARHNGATIVWHVRQDSTFDLPLLWLRWRITPSAPIRPTKRHPPYGPGPEASSCNYLRTLVPTRCSAERC